MVWKVWGFVQVWFSYRRKRRELETSNTFPLMLFSVVIFIKIKTVKKMVKIPLIIEVVVFFYPVSYCMC